MHYLWRQANRLAGSEKMPAIALTVVIVPAIHLVAMIIVAKYPVLLSWMAQHPIGATFLEPLVYGALMVGIAVVFYDWLDRKARRRPAYPGNFTWRSYGLWARMTGPERRK